VVVVVVVMMMMTMMTTPGKVTEGVMIQLVFEGAWFQSRPIVRLS
jgi:hypothetical protein